MKILAFILLLIPLVSFTQKDSTRLRDKFYLEINLGGKIGTVDENIGSYPELAYASYSFWMIHLDIDLNFRNRFIKAGISSNVLYYFDFNTRIGGNLFFSNINRNFYLGPFFKYGWVIKNLNGVKNSSALGLECYLRKFHFELSFSKFRTYESHYNSINYRMLDVGIGYAFNLESFRKKK